MASMVQKRAGAPPTDEGSTPVARVNGKFTAIRALLDSEPLCREIVRYLAHHNDAADTARGIAEWWLNRGVPGTKDALSQLQALGVVCAYPVHDSIVVYGYTKNPLLRQSLRHYVDETSRPHETTTQR